MLTEAQILGSDFYQQDTINVAEQLLGQKLVVQVKGRRLSGIINETEAYLGLQDPACHSCSGVKTARTKTFYLSGGHAYVYLIYGMYYCFNIVTMGPSQPEAVLIRSVLPVEGLSTMYQRSPTAKNDILLANGPGKLCRSFAIDKSFNEKPVFTGREVFVEKGDKHIPREWVESGPRIGIGYAQDAVHWPLRYYLDPQYLV